MEQPVKRVGLFISSYVFASSTSIINSAVMLADAGYNVDIFLSDVSHAEFVNFKDKTIKVYNFDEKTDTSEQAATGGSLRKVLDGFVNYCLQNKQSRFLASKIIPKALIKKYDFLIRKKVLYAHISRAIEIVKENQYKCFFGFDPFGLIFAHTVGEEKKIPILYYSLELYISSEKHVGICYNKALKKMEKAYNQEAVATIVQDEERGLLLSEENGVPVSKLFYVPVSILGSSFKERKQYFRKRFPIPEDKKIILCIGGLNDGNASLEIAKAANTLPDGWVLVFHGHHSCNPEYIQELMKYSTNVFFSMDMVMYDQLKELVSSADIGLALYKDLNPNYNNIGMSSGKIAHYFQCGLPIIVSDFPSTRKIIDSYNSGVCINGAEQISQAIKTISMNYEQYRENAFKCYQENYEFSAYFSKVVEKIESL